MLISVSANAGLLGWDNLFVSQRLMGMGRRSGRKQKLLLNFFSYGPLKNTQWVNKGGFILFNWNEINQRGQSLKTPLSSLCEVKVILLKMQSFRFSPCEQ